MSTTKPSAHHQTNGVVQSSPTKKNQLTPLFGLDIGGTLAKLAYFKPSADKSKSNDIASLKSLMKQLTCGGVDDVGAIEDEQLTIENMTLNGAVGSLHFLHFPVDKIEKFVALITNSALKRLFQTLHVTGGGAFKLERIFSSAGDITLTQHHEIQSMLTGIASLSNVCTSDKKPMCFSLKNLQSKDSIEKEVFDFSDPYPCLVANIGSGVSMTLAKSDHDFVIKHGSPFGGSSFLGLCSLLTGCSSFEEAVKLASSGDGGKVNKTLFDIYGADGGKIFGKQHLSLVASNFGKMINSKSRREAKKEDLASALLLTVADNIAHIAVDTAIQLNAEKIVYSGTFLRSNPIAMNILAGSTRLWSGGKMKALFLEHLGYHGAVGALFQSLN